MGCQHRGQELLGSRALKGPTLVNRAIGVSDNHVHGPVPPPDHDDRALAHTEKRVGDQREKVEPLEQRPPVSRTDLRRSLSLRRQVLLALGLGEAKLVPSLAIARVILRHADRPPQSQLPVIQETFLPPHLGQPVEANPSHRAESSSSLMGGMHSPARNDSPHDGHSSGTA